MKLARLLMIRMLIVSIPQFAIFFFPDQALNGFFPETSGAMYKVSQGFLTLSKMKGVDRKAESEKPWLTILRLCPWILLLMAVWVFQALGKTGSGSYPFDF